MLDLADCPRFALVVLSRCTREKWDIPSVHWVLLGVVGLGGLGLDHNRGVAALVELRLVGDRPYYVTGVEADGCSQCRQCRDQDTDDDFQNLLLAHNCVFSNPVQR